MSGKRQSSRTSEAGHFLLLPSLFLLTFSGLGLEVCLTRLFSVIYLHAYVYLLISLAMSGLGLGTVLLYFLNENAKKRYFHLLVYLPLPTFAALLGLTVFNAPLIASLLPTIMLFVYIGSSTTLLYQRTQATMPLLYFVDLSGAAAGALGSFFLLNWLGAIKAVIVLLVLISLSITTIHHLLFRPSYKLVTLNTALVLAVLLSIGLDLNLLAAPHRNPFKDMSTLMADKSKNPRIVATRWTAFGRSDLVETNNPLLKTLYIDGAAGTKMLEMRGDRLAPDLKESLIYQYVVGITLLPIPKNERNSAVVIGSGGGIDVVTLLASGFQHITAVEINPDFIDLVKSYSDYNGGIYNGHPHIRVINREGRSYIRTAGKSFDLILMSLPIIKSARNIGSYALTENHLFTYNAFNEYWRALDSAGYLIVVAHYPGELHRLVANAIKAFEVRGSDPREALKHMVTLGRDSAPVLILRKQPFTMADAETYYGMIRTLGQEGETNFIPYIDQHSITFRDATSGRVRSKLMFNRDLYALSRGEIDLEAYIDRQPQNASWISDDSPFFYQMESMIPGEILVVFGFAALVLICLVLAFLGRTEKNAHGGRGLFSSFALIGFAFILLEIATIQKFILFWGHQTMALAFLLALILVSTGLGSWVSGFTPAAQRKLNVSVGAIPLLALAFLLLAPTLLSRFETASAAVKVCVSAGLIAPLFFAMGFPFPTLLGIANDRFGTSMFPWMIGINCITTLFGGVAAILTAMLIGYRFVLLLGALTYFLLWGAMLVAGRKATVHEPQKNCPKIGQPLQIETSGKHAYP